MGDVEALEVFVVRVRAADADGGQTVDKHRPYAAIVFAPTSYDALAWTSHKVAITL